VIALADREYPRGLTKLGTRWARAQNPPMTWPFWPTLRSMAAARMHVDSGKPEEQQNTDDERDGGTDKSQDEQDPRSALVYATVRPPEITSAAPIKVSCPNFMPSPPHPARKPRQICPPTLPRAAMVRSQHNLRSPGHHLQAVSPGEGGRN